MVSAMTELELQKVRPVQKERVRKAYWQDGTWASP